MRQLLTAVVLVLLAACSATDPERVRLDLTIDRTAIARSDSLDLTLTLTNVSARFVKVFAPDAYGTCIHAFQVFDRDHREVSVASMLCAAMSMIAPPELRLAPGQSITIVDRWRPATSMLGGQPLAPGAYRIRGRVAADDQAVTSRFVDVTLLP